MAGRGFISSLPVVLFFAALAALLYTAELPRVFTVLGFWRPKAKIINQDSAVFHEIPDTIHCEDLHYHEPSNLLFTACEGTESTRAGWFPGLGRYHDPTAALKSQGTLEKIDPNTMTSQRLEFTNFNGPFVTHGIDIIDDPDKAQGEAIYIFAINHVPSADYSENRKAKGHKARSIIEVFHHDIGSSTVQHVRSVWHSLITTPNDIAAVSPTSFFVTNDHFFREGVLRCLEQFYFGAKWTRTIFIEFDDVADGAFRNDDHQVKGTVAIEGMHNNNGLGHGRTSTELMISSCWSGRLHMGEVSTEKVGQGQRTIRIKDSVEFDSVVDNPSWFHDPFPAHGHDASGLVVAGVPRIFDAARGKDYPLGNAGAIVWAATPAAGNSTSSKKDLWKKRLLFEDDSARIRSASAAVLVAIDPVKESGEKRAWLFVAGYVAKSVIAVKVDL